jgi:hypothetical protein
MNKKVATQKVHHIGELHQNLFTIREGRRINCIQQNSHSPSGGVDSGGTVGENIQRNLCTPLFRKNKTNNLSPQVYQNQLLVP